MSEPSSEQEELQAALEDVRRIRDLLDEMSEQNPMRVLMRPLFKLGFAFAPLMLLYGVLSQWVLDAPGDSLFGVGKVALLCLLGVGFCLLGAVMKSFVAWRAARHKGINVTETMVALHSVGYPRLIFPIFLVHGILCVYLAQLGQAHQIPGIFIAMYGVILLLMPLALPVPTVTGLGYSLILMGAVSLYVLPAYPFYKIGVCMGLACAWLGYAGYHDKNSASRAKDTG